MLEPVQGVRLLDRFKGFKGSDPLKPAYSHGRFKESDPVF